MHGVRIRSSIGLSGVPVESTGPVDLEIVEVEHLPAPRQTDRPVLAYDYPTGHEVRAGADAAGATAVAFSDSIRFRISPDQRRIEMAIEPGGDRGLAHILVQGWMLAMALALRGDVALHATTVAFDGRAVAFLGDSGMGKSTMAALLVRDGASLIGDDVLRVERLADRQWVAHPGSTTIRLRDAASELGRSLAELDPAVTVETSTDGRLVVDLPRQDPEPVDLAAVIVPFPTREIPEPVLEWLDPAVAAVELNRYPRVYEWQDPEPVRRQFEVTCALGGEVPVGLMGVPWGPPWPRGLLQWIRSVLPAEPGR